MIHSTSNPNCTCHRLDGEPCHSGNDWISPHICCECGGVWTPVEGHTHMTPEEAELSRNEWNVQK